MLCAAIPAAVWGGASCASAPEPEHAQPPSVGAPADAPGAGATDAALPGSAHADASAAPTRADAAPPAADASAAPGAATTVIAEPADEAAYIYDPSALRTYELLLAQADLDTLDADPSAEMYVPGMLRFEGREYGPVGIRYKGSAGAFFRCVAGGTIGEPSGPKTCRKLSMKVAFDHIDPEGRFYGLRKLQFHAMRNDTSLMRERLGYRLFRAAGVPAPRAVHARLLVNGVLEGAFVLVEQIDGRFTRSRFSDGGEGNLYKEVWPIHDVEQPYLDALETNEDAGASGANMLAFARALSAGEGDALVGALDTYLDRDAILTYLAVDRSISHADGPLMFYCNMPAGQGGNPGPFGNHNYYWYEQTTAPRFWIVPWDLDFSFNSLNFGGQSQTAWYEPVPAEACACAESSGQNGGMALRRRPAACDKLIQGLALLRAQYAERARAFAAGPFRAEAVDADLDAWSAQIAQLVAEQAQDPEQQPTVEAWRSSLASLRDTIDALRAAAAAQ